MVEVTGVATVWESSAPNFSKSAANPWASQHCVSVPFFTSQPGRPRHILGHLRVAFWSSPPPARLITWPSSQQDAEPESPNRIVPFSRMGLFKDVKFPITWRCSLQGHRHNLPVSPDRGSATCGRCTRARQTSEASLMSSVSWDDSVCVPCDWGNH